MKKLKRFRGSKKPDLAMKLKPVSFGYLLCTDNRDRLLTGASSLMITDRTKHG